MAFLDEDEYGSESGARRHGADRQRQIMVRRLIALGVGVGILILLVLGVRSCLDARKERGFENYVSDLTSIAEQSQQLSQQFFERLENPPKNTSPLQIEAQVSADRGTAEGLLRRVEELDTPDELAAAQDELVQAFELRRDAIAGVADAIPSALGDENRVDAVSEIANDMKVLLASDVLYGRALAEIGGVLEAEAIPNEIPETQFLPDPPEQWLDDLELTTKLSALATDTGAVTGIHGLELVSTSIGGTALVADTANTVTLDGPAELDIEVSNGGDSTESDISVRFELSGGTEPLEGETTIPRISAGGIESVTLPIEADPETGVELSLEVTVVPVPGEELVDNNAATYLVTFD